MPTSDGQHAERDSSAGLVKKLADMGIDGC